MKERFEVYGRSNGGGGFVLYYVADNRIEAKREMTRMWDNPRIHTVKVTRSMINEW